MQLSTNYYKALQRAGQMQSEDKIIIKTTLRYDTDVEIIRQGIQNNFDYYIKVSKGKVDNKQKRCVI